MSYLDQLLFMGFLYVVLFLLFWAVIGLWRLSVNCVHRVRVHRRHAISLNRGSSW